MGETGDRLNWTTIIAGGVAALGAIVVAYFGFLGVKSNRELTPGPQRTAQELRAPFLVADNYIPSGWMGDGKSGAPSLTFDAAFRKTRTGNPNGTCIRVVYKPGEKPGDPHFAGIYWQYPADNWGQQPGRRIRNATRVTFWAAGERGGESVQFIAGGISGGGAYQDSFRASVTQRLEKEWRQISIPLRDYDLSQVIGAFAWSASADSNPNGLTMYLDDIRYE